MNINNRETILQELRRIKPDLEKQYGVTKYAFSDLLPATRFVTTAMWM